MGAVEPQILASELVLRVHQTEFAPDVTFSDGHTFPPLRLPIGHAGLIYRIPLGGVFHCKGQNLKIFLSFLKNFVFVLFAVCVKLCFVVT